MVKHDRTKTFILNVDNLALNKICGEIKAMDPKFNIKFKKLPSWEKFEF